MRSISGLATPTATLQVTRETSDACRLKVIFANREEKTALVTIEQLRRLTHQGAKVEAYGVVMRRNVWTYGKKRGPKPACVFMYFEGKGSDLIIVSLQDLIRATGVRP